MVSTIVYSQPSLSHDTTTCQGRTSFSPLQIKALNTRFLYGQLGTVAAGQLLTPATLCLVFLSGKLTNCAREQRREDPMECTLVAATCKCLRTKAYIQQRFLCSMWNARVISTATSQLKAGRLSKNKIYSYLCVGGIPSVSLHWQFLLRQLGFMLNAIRAITYF